MYNIKEMTKLKTIYKELGIKYDLREARKYLKVDKKLPRLEVNRLLKEKYNEENPSGHIYTLHGTAYSVRLDKKKKEYVITSPQKISISFYKDGKRKAYQKRRAKLLEEREKQKIEIII